MDEQALSSPCPCCQRPTKTRYCAYCTLMVQAEIERPGTLRRAEAEARKQGRRS